MHLPTLAQEVLDAHFAGAALTLHAPADMRPVQAHGGELVFEHARPGLRVVARWGV